MVSLPLMKALPTPARRTSGGLDIDLLSRWGLLRFSLGSGDRFYSWCRSTRLLEEPDLHRHVGQDPRVFLFEPNTHLDGCLLAVGGRHHGDHSGGHRPVGIGIEYGRNGATRPDTTDEGFVDIDFDFDRTHVDDRAYAGAGEAAGRHR